MSRRVLIVSPYFPPSTLAGVHRARHLAKHLPAAGWTPTVLCVDEAHHEERLDPGLAALVPPSVEVVKVGAAPARLTRLAGVGEIGLRAYLHLAAGLRRTLKTRPYDAVMITGSPFYPMLLAGLVKREFGAPTVLDFQDPWVTPATPRLSLLSKAEISRALAKRLEPAALRAADFITSVSERQNEELAERHPWLDRERMAAIPIGGDPDDYVALRAAPAAGEVRLDPARINFVYVGTLLPRGGGVARALFDAVSMLVTEHPRLRERLRFTFVGTSNQPNGSCELRATPIAEAAGIADMVVEHAARVPYLEALGLLARADVILLLGSDEPHYTASKIYPALLSGRPSFGLFQRASSAFDILSRAGAARAIGFTDIENLAGRRCELARILTEASCGSETFGALNPSVVEAYEARAIARRFADVFEAASGAGPAL